MLDKTLNAIREYADEFHSGKGVSYKNALLLSGGIGTGKTYSALCYCEEKSDNLFFSFEAKDCIFALKIFVKQYPTIFEDCDNWHSFFEQLKTYGKEKRPTVFFDNVSDRDDKDEFFSELKLFLDDNSSYDVLIVLLSRPQAKIDVSYRKIGIVNYNYYNIYEDLSLSYNDAMRLALISSGIPGLVSAYNTELSFNENITAMLNTSSLYYTLAKRMINECFRITESYTSLLYAMANGYNRVSELARFTGYPKNKCDKYIKSLMECNFVKKVTGNNGYAKYYLANEYLSLWCGVLMTAVPNADGSFGKEVQNAFMKHLNENFLSDIYKDMCYDWLKQNINSFSNNYIDVKDSTYRNIKVGGITFDFVCTKDTAYYAYFNTVPGDKLTMKLWADIENATTKASPFYKNEYIIFSVNRVSDGYWKLSKQYDNVHIVKLESLYACFMEEYNRSVHPRFVPSFVRNRGIVSI